MRERKGKAPLVFAVANQKGGVGKTATADALAAYLSHRGRVLAVDMDPQGSLSYSYSVDATGGGPNVLDLLKGRRGALECITRVEGRGDIIAAAPLLELKTQTIEAAALVERLEPLKEIYSYIVIDCPPALGRLTVNALTAADRLVIPAMADVFGLEAVRLLLDNVVSIREINPRLTVAGILLTRHNPRTILAGRVLEALQGLAGAYGVKVAAATIPAAVAVAEAVAARESLFTYAAGSRAAEAYKEAFYELLK